MGIDFCEPTLTIGYDMVSILVSPNKKEGMFFFSPLTCWASLWPVLCCDWYHNITWAQWNALRWVFLRAYWCDVVGTQAHDMIQRYGVTAKTCRQTCPPWSICLPGTLARLHSPSSILESGCGAVVLVVNRNSYDGVFRNTHHSK